MKEKIILTLLLITIIPIAIAGIFILEKCTYESIMGYLLILIVYVAIVIKYFVAHWNSGTKQIIKGDCSKEIESRKYKASERMSKKGIKNIGFNKLIIVIPYYLIVHKLSLDVNISIFILCIILLLVFIPDIYTIYIYNSIVQNGYVINARIKEIVISTVLGNVKRVSISCYTIHKGEKKIYKTRFDTNSMLENVFDKDIYVMVTNDYNQGIILLDEKKIAIYGNVNRIWKDKIRFFDFMQ